MIIDAESSACVDCFENDAITAELADQFGDAFDCLAEGLGRADLRANVNADAKGLQPFVAGDALVESAGAADVDAELVLAEAGRDVGVGIGKYVGVYAQGEPRRALKFAGAGSEKRKFRFAFNVELKDTGIQGEVYFRGGLAYAGEDDPIRGIGCSREDALQFAAGDDVEPGTPISQQLENGESRVGLDGVADEMITGGERVLEKRESFRDLVGGVDVKRGLVAAGQGGQRDFSAMQRAAGSGIVERARGWGGRLGHDQFPGNEDAVLRVQHEMEEDGAVEGLNPVSMDEMQDGIGLFR